MNTTQANLNNLLEKAFSFVILVDSKLIGLTIFLIANLFTGFINLTLTTAKLSHLLSLIILLLNSFLSSAFPLGFYYYKKFILK